MFATTTREASDVRRNACLFVMSRVESLAASTCVTASNSVVQVVAR